MMKHRTDSPFDAKLTNLHDSYVWHVNAAVSAGHDVTSPGAWRRSSWTKVSSCSCTFATNIKVDLVKGQARSTPRPGRWWVC